MLLLVFWVLGGSWVFPQEIQKKDQYDDARLNTPAPFTLGDRDRILIVEMKLDAMQKQMDLRFEAMDKRLDGMDKRLDAMDKRLDGMDRRFDFLQNLLWAIIGLLVALGTGVFAQMQRINKLLAKHEGILSERQRQEAVDALTRDVARLKRNVEALQHGTTGNA